MKTLRSWFLALAALLCVSPAFATVAGWSNATVQHIVYESTQQTTGGLVYIIFTTNGGGTAACASGYRNSIAIDTSTVSGVAALGVFQLAQASGATIYSVVGTGTCISNGGIENLAWVDQ